MKNFILIFCILGMGKVAIAQAYLPLTAGSGNPLSGALYVNTPALNFANARMGMGTLSDVTKSHFFQLENTGTNIIMGTENDSGTGNITTGGLSGSAFIGTAYSKPFQIITSNIVRQTIDGSGNVGIGTTTPAEKLSVNGKIRAKEIKVETSGWPDYVFEPSYKLPDLKETEQFVKENNHLPEIPSAKEVEENGIDLGEMNAKLLKKIEELTLYLIEKDKQVTDLQQRMKAVEGRKQ